MVILYKKCKKYNEIQLAKNKITVNNQIMKNHPPSQVLIKMWKSRTLEHGNRKNYVFLKNL